MFESLFNEKGILALVAQGSLISHAVLVLLIIMSSVSWALILLKLVQYRRIQVENEEFLLVFQREKKLEQLNALANEFTLSTHARLFESCYKEFFLFRQKMPQLEEKELDKAQIHERFHQRMERVLTRCINQQAYVLEARLSWLATISSASPFIGLFGTVLGIIDSFQNIGSQGATSLAVVAPGISEALVATAAGLLAAIPALMAYNGFRNQAKSFSTSMKNFALDLNNRFDWIV